MSANPNKFQYMLLGPVVGFSVRMPGHHIETQDPISIPGFTFDNELKLASI